VCYNLFVSVCVCVLGRVHVLARVFGVRVCLWTRRWMVYGACVCVVRVYVSCV
jgi:hypothetical protein